MVELAWLWLQNQPTSSLSLWFHEGLVLRPLIAGILIGAARNKRDNLPERGFCPFFLFLNF
jgi:hypothetical protein